MTKKKNVEQKLSNIKKIVEKGPWKNNPSCVVKIGNCWMDLFVRFFGLFVCLICLVLIVH